MSGMSRAVGQRDTMNHPWLRSIQSEMQLLRGEATLNLDREAAAHCPICHAMDQRRRDIIKKHSVHFGSLIGAANLIDNLSESEVRRHLQDIAARGISTIGARE